jgi:hypothetical protein
MYSEKFTRQDHEDLTSYVEKMPVIMTQTHEVHRLTGAELQDMGYVEWKGFKIDPEETYLYNAPVLVAANHYRRLKRAWVKHGYSGVEFYLREVAKALQLNAEKTANDKAGNSQRN